LPPFKKVTSVPKELSKASAVLMSLNIGAFVSVTGSSVRSVTGINVRHAFFAPAIGIFPFRGLLPLTNIASKFNPFGSPFLRL
jgi:hypothetical protein